MVITFQSQPAFGHLQKHGCVITFRKNKRKNPYGKTWANKGRNKPKEFDVHVSEICEINNGIGLDKYAHLSGFGDENRWKVEIRALNNGDIPDTGYLYFVTKQE